jgi:prephenate dehydrogenase
LSYGVASNWHSIAIVGVGLIGGSVGLALRERGLARRIVGIGRRKEPLERAMHRGAVTETTLDLAGGVREAELVVVSRPVERIVEDVREAAAHCPATAVITDAGSTKRAIVEGLRDLRRDGAAFVGSHPMAGSQKSGVEHAAADLFSGRTTVITPDESTSAEAIRRVRGFWSALGANVVTLSPADHDEVVATISHLPHAVASILAASTPVEHLPLAATGWLDTTRVAAGDVDMWRQILQQNRECVLQSIHRFGKLLEGFVTALEQEDGEAIAEILAIGKQRRDALAD